VNGAAVETDWFIKNFRNFRAYPQL